MFPSAYEKFKLIRKILHSFDGNLNEKTKDFMRFLGTHILQFIFDNVVFLNFVKQGAVAYFKQPCRMGMVSLCLFQGFLDQIDL